MTPHLLYFFDACRLGHLETVQTHLTRVDLTCVDAHGQTPLLVAASTGHADVVRALLPGSDTTVVDRQGLTALMNAAQFGQVDAIHALLPVSDPLFCNPHDTAFHQQRMDALAFAVAGGHLKAVQALIPVSDVEQARIAGLPLLFYAMNRGLVALFDVLLAAGAHTWVEDLDHPFAGERSYGVLHAFARGPFKADPTGAWRGLLPRLTALVDPLRRNDRGQTPLMLAIFLARLDSTLALLPEPNVWDQHRDEEGRSLLEQALHVCARQARFGRLRGPRPVVGQIVEHVIDRMDPKVVHRTLTQHPSLDVSRLLPRWYARQEVYALKTVVPSLQDDDAKGTSGRQRL